MRAIVRATDGPHQYFVQVASVELKFDCSVESTVLDVKTAPQSI